MYRKELIDILLEHPMTLQELSERLDEPAKDVADDLHHLQKSLRHEPYRLEIRPARCRKCGFVFQADKMTKPGKCPQCRGTWIQAPEVVIHRQ